MNYCYISIVLSFILIQLTLNLFFPIRSSNSIINKVLVLEQILLFVSDGRGNNYIGGNPLEVIREENEALQNSVVINTYGIGTGGYVTASSPQCSVR